MAHEASDEKDKFVTSDSLNLQKLCILLMLALTKTKNSKKSENILININ
ncbi:hypothetical protein ACFW1D_28365 [Priestia megaterium]